MTKQEYWQNVSNKFHETDKNILVPLRNEIAALTAEMREHEQKARQLRKQIKAKLASLHAADDENGKELSRANRILRKHP